MSKQHYIVSDLKRLLKSYEFYLSFLGVAAVLFFSLEDVGISDAGVVFTYVFATDMTGMMLSGGHYFLYCILFALQLGLFAGTLSVL